MEDALNAFLFVACVGAAHPWPHVEPPARTVGDLPVPAGFTRVEVTPGSWGAWLRTLPLKEGRPPLRLFNGEEKPFQGGYAAIIDMDVGTRDLQQCADAAIRLRAEYLRAAGRDADACFHFTSGDKVPWSRWRSGERPRVTGNKVSWKAGGAESSSWENYRAYLSQLYVFAGSISVMHEVEPVPVADVQPGDVFVEGGSPGHAVTVLDVARAPGRIVVMVAQSYMPAQEVHVVGGPGAVTDAWYEVRSAAPLVLPEWSFSDGTLGRWPANACSRWKVRR